MISHLTELWKYRALVAALVERHLHARYRGSMLGLIWSFLNPLCLMAVYTLVFKYYIRFTEVENYTIFLFCGLLQWLHVSSAMLEGSTSISSGGSLITKSLFPAHLLSAVSVLTSLVHFLLSLPLLFIFMFASGVGFHWTLLLLPLLMIVQTVFLYGLALFLGTFNVAYRDVQHLVGNALTLLFFLCPVLYPASSVPPAFQPFLAFNPFAVFTACYQDVLYYGTWPDVIDLVQLTAWSGITLIIGISTYSAHREGFAEAL
ncbi:MAG: ABC transporter permease [Bdellovibrionales bacterium]|nr:ABC transporter permease [Bdellovibrionales bacterium]